MSETTTWMTVADAAVVYDAATADIVVRRHPGFLPETTAEFLARSLRNGDLPAKLDCTTGRVWVDAYAVELIVELAVLLAVDQLNPHSLSRP